MDGLHTASLPAANNQTIVQTAQENENLALVETDSTPLVEATQQVSTDTPVQVASIRPEPVSVPVENKSIHSLKKPKVFPANFSDKKQLDHVLP